MRKTYIIATLTASLMAGAANAQVSDDVVKIGVLNDRTGVYEDLSGDRGVEVVRMAIEDFGGTVLGKRIEIVEAGHENKMDLASSLVRRWIDTEQVDTVVDIMGSGVALAINEIARDSDRIMIAASAATSELTGAACSPNTFQFSYDTYALAKGTATALVGQGKDTWFFVTADYAFGHALEEDGTRFIEEGGGTVLGSVRSPLGTTDYSSFLLQAQSSGASIVALATAGGDTINSVKQAGEFGIVESGQNLAALLVYINDVNALGLEAAQGLMLTTSFYWDLNEETREWTQRFLERTDGQAPPNMLNAGLYAGVLHYLKAVEAAGTDETQAVADKMRELRVNDFYNKDVEIRADGRVMHKMFLMEVASPEESEGKFDYYRLVAEIPAEEAFRPLSEGGCPLASN